MIINAAFTAGQVVFEVPTGVVADTLGRRTSYLLSVAIILISTLLYGYVGFVHGGILLFMLSSVLLGLGFTFYTGAVDAWMIDALKSIDYKGKIEIIFARAGVVFGISMLLGTVAGGLLGQYQLVLPYIARAVLLIPAFLLGLFFMKDIGFTPKKFQISQFGAETARIARVGTQYGLQNKTARYLMFATFAQSLFFIYGFYSWQKYFLDLLNQNLVWVSGVIAALIGLSQILGNLLVKKATEIVKERASLIKILIFIQAVAIIGAAIAGDFYLAVGLYILATTAFGILGPVKATWFNSVIPSSERATLISLDALFADGGGTIGQLGFGYMSKAISIPFAWLVGGIVQLAGIPAIAMAKKNESQ